ADLGPLELAGDAAVGQVQADRELGVAFVDAVGEPPPAPRAGAGVPGVGVDALVEVDEVVRRVHVLVLGREAQRISRNEVPSVASVVDISDCFASSRCATGASASDGSTYRLLGSA